MNVLYVSFYQLHGLTFFLGCGKIDKLPIVVTTASGEEQILRIPSLQRGTGDLMSKALNDHLIRWDAQ